jgi:hypothetical protein
MQLTWGQVYRDPGLKWERITHPPVPLPPGIDSLYSIRVTQARRAVVYRYKEFLRFRGSRKIMTRLTQKVSSDRLGYLGQGVGDDGGNHRGAARR